MNENRTLRYRPDGTFKLMQLTDIHYSRDDDADRRTVELMRELIEAERPDFVMTTGDTVYGEKNAEYLEKALKPILEARIPFGYVFGNHDVEFAGDREALFERILELPGCMAWHDPASGDGKGNCYLNLVNREDKCEWMLFGIDSGDYCPLPQVGGYGYVTPRQIAWYRDRIARQAETGDPFSALVFMHMALPEYEQVWKYEVCYGTKRDGIGAPRVNSGFFSAMLEAGHTKGVFVGHDHVNDFWGRLYGIILGYGRCTGFGTYGAQDYPRGCRMFTFHEGDTQGFETYVRLEHGIVVDDPWIEHPKAKRDEG